MFGINTKIMLGMGVAMAVMAGGFYFYFDYAEDRMATLNQSVAEMKTAVESQKQTISLMEAKVEQANAASAILSEQVSVIREKTGELENVLSQHDLGYLAGKKPGLIENRVNRATKKTLDEFEDITDPQRKTK